MRLGYNLTVRRDTVMRMTEVDQAVSALRKARKLVHASPKPNAALHVDGYNKLKL